MWSSELCCTVRRSTSLNRSSCVAPTATMSGKAGGQCLTTTCTTTTRELLTCSVSLNQTDTPVFTFLQFPLFAIQKERMQKVPIFCIWWYTIQSHTYFVFIFYRNIDFSSCVLWCLRSGQKVDVSNPRESEASSAGLSAKGCNVRKSNFGCMGEIFVVLDGT